jgi:hypothetical protein
MRVKNDIQKFSTACELLLGDIALERPLTNDEALLIKHYCNEVLIKVDQPPANPAQAQFPLS